MEGQAAVVGATVEAVLDDQLARSPVQSDTPAVDGRWAEAPVAVVGRAPLGHRAAVQPGRALELGSGLSDPEMRAGRQRLVDAADLQCVVGQRRAEVVAP